MRVLELKAGFVAPSDPVVHVALTHDEVTWMKSALLQYAREAIGSADENRIGWCALDAVALWEAVEDSARRGG